MKSMKVRAIIPFKPKNPKTRLSGLLSQQEREDLACGMLTDVVAAVTAAGCTPSVLSTHQFFFGTTPVITCAEGLSEALNHYLALHSGPLLIIMADLPLATREAVLLATQTHADIAICPGRGGGTNVIFLKDCRKFRTDYYGASFLKHLAIAREFGLSCEVLDSFRLHTDIDEDDDLVELLIHGTGESSAFLTRNGFVLTSDKGRVRVERR
jgi:2-phospho-L-lactate guanylyltransferase